MADTQPAASGPSLSDEELQALRDEQAATELLRQTLLDPKAKPLDLSDPILVTRIFRTVAEDVVATYVQTCGDKGDAFDKTIELLNLVAGGLAQIFTGCDPRFAPVKDWHPAGLAARLRQIEGALDKGQETDTDANVVTHAIVNLLREVFLSLVEIKRSGQLTEDVCGHVIQYAATTAMSEFTDLYSIEDVNARTQAVREQAAKAS